MNALDQMILNIVEFVASTEEDVTVISYDDPISFTIGYRAYYLKDGYEYDLYEKVNVMDAKKCVGCYFRDSFTSSAKRIELAKAMSSCKSFEELKLSIKMHEALS